MKIIITVLVFSSLSSFLFPILRKNILFTISTSVNWRSFIKTFLLGNSDKHSSILNNNDNNNNNIVNVIYTMFICVWLLVGWFFDAHSLFSGSGSMLCALFMLQKIIDKLPTSKIKRVVTKIKLFCQAVLCIFKNFMEQKTIFLFVFNLSKFYYAFLPINWNYIT